MKSRRYIGITAISCLIFLVLTACSGQEADNPQTAELTVTMTDFAFAPPSVNVPPGSEVSLTLKNEGEVIHTYYIMEADYTAEAPFDEEDEGHVFWESPEIQPGESRTLTFTAPEQAGTHQVVCDIAGHLEAGMVGEFVVGEGSSGQAPSEDSTGTAAGSPTMESTEEAAGTPTQSAQEGDEEGIEAGELEPSGFTVALEQVAEGFIHPLVYTYAPDDSGRMFVADQMGVIYIIGVDGEKQDTPFLDIADRMVQVDPTYDERGLLGLAFHPNYAENGRFFVYYSAPLRDGAPEGWDHTSHLSEFTISSDNADVADADSERILMQIDQPQTNHDGGQIVFGPDGYLYIPLGDGGGANDTGEGHVDDWYEDNGGGNGQDRDQNLLGSILRIDVDNGNPYSIPADNPWGDEQWAFGFRNPFRISFDSGGDHWLYVGDAGQDRYEEIHVVEAGGNYGWNIFEGTYCFDANDPAESLEECPNEDPEGNPLLDPVIQFKNINQPDGLGLVVVGGNVYRGSQIPEMEGMYVFGSWSSSWSETKGQLFVSEPDDLDGGLWDMYALSLVDSEMGLLNGMSILSFGEDPQGDLYVLTTESIGPSDTSGKIWKIVPAPEGASGNTDEHPTPTAEPSSGSSATATPASGSSASSGETTTELTVDMREFAFSPASYTVPAGEEISITLNNSGSVKHSFVIMVKGYTAEAPFDQEDANNIFWSSDAIAPGASATLTFEAPDEPGTYQVVCDIPGHLEAGMVAELTVK